ncbi:P2Y purinoceptor 14 isoform X2 [Leopardus geoffroyi]|uniref:P2Y purinoceptor 14 isoform X2 n=1 Tax=Leopardus geoffroyi TaxID=46844 RepID=UPI001E265EF4|nr:P2Y purinoceptor 14 isoform X2 [Leopardus geoffroyi]
MLFDSQSKGCRQDFQFGLFCGEDTSKRVPKRIIREGTPWPLQDDKHTLDYTASLTGSPLFYQRPHHAKKSFKSSLSKRKVEKKGRRERGRCV